MPRRFGPRPESAIAHEPRLPVAGAPHNGIAPIDFVLGEGSARQRRRLLQRARTDRGLAADLAATRDLVLRFWLLRAPWTDRRSAQVARPEP